MTSGGHARSGPAPDPRSGASDRKGLKFSALPAEGYSGDVPEFPTPVVFGSELKWWKWAWTTPQAALWATPQWSWVIPAVADWCRLKAQSESVDAPVAVWSAIARREADILLTNDSLLRAGYRVAANELGERREGGGEKPRQSSRDRLKLAPSVGR